MSQPTASQQQAIEARGNVLVVAGAGTGKTSTVVARALRLLLEEGGSLDQMLMVTFTEAAATEMRQRIRGGLLRRLAAQPAHTHATEQLALLDTACLSTLHSFCLQLVTDHACELAIDPQVTVLDESQTQPLIEETLEALLARHYRADSPLAPALKDLVRRQGRGSDERIRHLLIRLHRFTQTLPDPAAWFETQIAQFNQAEPAVWRRWLGESAAAWRDAWRPMLRSQPAQNTIAHQCVKALSEADTPPALLAAVAQAHELGQPQHWPRGTKGKFREPIEKFFDEAEFLSALAPPAGDVDPLRQDWEWVRAPMLTLLRLAREFTEDFSRAKRELGGLDFADLEQFSLRLLMDPATHRPSAIARAWQGRFQHVFVDEYQDINAAQDAILTALSREGPEANRFLVGDVKQSIYRFRLANPAIFRRYEENWRQNPTAGTRIPLAENFRSREAVLDFVNGLFGALMRPAIGGVDYDADARLQFGDRDGRHPLTREAGSPSVPAGPCVEFHLLTRAEEAEEAEETEEDGAAVFDLTAAEREARLVALRLRELKEQGHLVWDNTGNEFRPATWSDMAVLLRSPANKVEAYAKEFHRAGVPLQAARGGFYGALEVMDLHHLLKLLDNPLQDVPLLAVLRSPLVGMSLAELVEVRACSREPRFWTALQVFHREGASSRSAWRKADEFLRHFEAWRDLVRLVSLSACLESVLAETHYEALLRAGERGAARAANVRKFMDLARQYDPYQRQGLFRFLRFLTVQEDAGQDLEPAPLPTTDAVQLMSIHKSKGLEFPVVVVADLGKRFNLGALNEDILLEEAYGLCPQVTPPESDQRYPSLPYWLARQRERRELLGEELRLLYVALTRARDTLILTGFDRRKDAAQPWAPAPAAPIPDAEILKAQSYLDWLRRWLPQVTTEENWQSDTEGAAHLLRWRIWNEADPRLAVPVEAAVHERIAAMENLAPETVQWVEARLAWQYPAIAATTEPAKTSASALKRRRTEADDETGTLLAFQGTDFEFQIRHRTTETPGRLSAVERGLAHHTFLEHVALAQADNVAALREEAARLARAGVLASAEVAALDLEAVAAFWRSNLGRRIRAEAGRVQRELEFTAGFSAAELAGLGLSLRTPLPDEETLVVQGVVDLAVLHDDAIWLVDFKTDEVAPANLGEKVSGYAPQLKLYGLALERILRRPVTERWLHFLKTGQTVAV